jgi:hypothetical protein
VLIFSLASAAAKLLAALWFYTKKTCKILLGPMLPIVDRKWLLIYTNYLCKWYTITLLWWTWFCHNNLSFLLMFWLDQKLKGNWKWDVYDPIVQWIKTTRNKNFFPFLSFPSRVCPIKLFSDVIKTLLNFPVTLYSLNIFKLV